MGSLIIVSLAALLGFIFVESIHSVTNTNLNLFSEGVDIILAAILIYFGIKTSLKKDYGADKEKVEKRAKDKYTTFGFYSSALLAMVLFSLNFITTVLVFLASNQSII